MSTERNKTTVRDVFERVVNQGDLAFVDEAYAPGFVDRSAWPGQTPGPAGIREAVGDLRATLPDLQVTVEQIIAEGDDVGTRESWRGTHRPTGQPVAGTVMHFFRFAGAQIVEEWSEGWGWLEQLPASPAAGQPGA